MSDRPDFSEGKEVDNGPEGASRKTEACYKLLTEFYKAGDLNDFGIKKNDVAKQYYSLSCQDLLGPLEINKGPVKPAEPHKIWQGTPDHPCPKGVMC